MIPVSLSLKNKQVLIVGGGNVALRKTYQFLKEGAMITILSPTLLSDFKELHICYIKGKYQTHYLQNMFLVYASTNDEIINHQIVLDCQKRNILCGSATYDQDVSFYSMMIKEHEVATMALSMHQKLPYSQPLLNQLMKVLDDNQERIEKIERLRPHIIQYVENKKEYFQQLFDCDIKILDFIYQSIQDKRGTLYIYHQSEYKEKKHFSLYPYIELSLKELEEYKSLFVFPIYYQVIPLIVYDGYIYQKLVNMISYHWKIYPPLIHSKQDIQYILSLFYQEDRQMIYLIHPRNSFSLKEMLMNEIKNNESIYDFDEDMILKKDKKYYVVIMLMTHGKHYYDIINNLKSYQNQGYDIEYSEILLEYPQIREYIENRSS